jgi:putative addiction module component (TIGR02574 family)
MNIKTSDLIAMIESMPIDVRTNLVEIILASLQPIQKDIDELWVQEVEERISDIKSGKVQLLSGEEVFQEIKGIFR